MPTWNKSNAKHLLSRATFGFDRQILNAALAMSLDSFVDNVLLKKNATPPPPGTWVNNPPGMDANLNSKNVREMMDWWLKLMYADKSIHEKMTLFWHNHFVTCFEKTFVPEWLYPQNQLLREYALGNVKDLAKKITIDAAMLHFLDGKDNDVRHPNENYGRELLELFCMGIGNYTEKDVQELARALTGWKIEFSTNKVRFDAIRFDNGSKTIFGKTANFDYLTAIDWIFEQNQTAIFICKKIYTRFVFYQADDAFVKEMANVLRTNNYEIKPVLAFLFKSDHFYQDKFKAVDIKSPVEMTLGTVKFLGFTNPPFTTIAQLTSSQQQTLFNPPDVRGWTEQRNWISTTTLPLRNIFCDAMVYGVGSDGKPLSEVVNWLSFARSFASAEKPREFVAEICDLMLNYPISDKQKDFLLTTLLDGTIEANWSTFFAGADQRIMKFFRTLMRLSEYQLQ